jgi:hypothetical protein
MTCLMDIMGRALPRFKHYYVTIFDIYFRFHKSKLASRPLDIEHVKYTDTTEQKTTKPRQIK